MASMQSLKPASKVCVGSIVAASATLVVALIQAIGNTKISGTIAVSISTVLSFIVSCLAPPSDNDQVVT